MMKKLIPLLLGLAVVLGLAVLSGVTPPAGAASRSGPSATATLQAQEDAAAGESADALAGLEAAYADGVVDINLGQTITVSGAGATAAGGTVTITSAGVYSLSGTLESGALVVEAKGKVYLEFDEVSITSPSGPALVVNDAKKVVITLVEGTQNLLADTAGSSDDIATLFTNDTLLVNGKGTLVVVGNNNEAISSDDDIIINSGTLRVTAVDDGLNAHDDITVNGGDLIISAGGDGLDSNGTIHINGGTLVAFGGTTVGEGGIDALGDFTITGGTVVAGGNTSAAVSTDSKQGTVTISAAGIQAAGTSFLLAREGEEIFTFAPEAAYRTLFVSSPDLIMGAEYEAYLGDGAGTAVVATR